MTLDQIQYVCAVYENKSISKAARELYVSQPNISKAIAKLERELGFNIIIRKKNGVEFTEKGQEFVYRGTKILKECQDLGRREKKDQTEVFTVCGPTYPAIAKAFYRLSLEYMGWEEEQSRVLNLQNASDQDSLKRLEENKTDLAILLLPETDYESHSFKRKLMQLELNFHFLARVPVCVKLAQSHPLLQAEKFDLEQLHRYPMINYSMSDGIKPQDGLPYMPFSITRKALYVDSSALRNDLIQHSAAWGFCAQMSRSDQEAENVRCIPIPDCFWILGYISIQEGRAGHLEKLYLKYLQDEIAFLEAESTCWKTEE